MNKKNIILIFSILFSLCVFAQDIQDLKQQAIALYSTKNYNEAQKLLKDFPASEKNEEILLLLSNIALENGDYNLAIQNLNKALDKNYKYYKAYYNLGYIFALKKSYLLASNNFDLAIKYNKDFAPAYYNLAYIQIELKNYEAAKKNLIKAINIDANNKDAYYNLAYCYKELGKKKQAKKVLETYNKMN